MRPDRVVRLDAEGQRAGRFAQRTVTGVRALVLGTSRRQVARQGRIPGPSASAGSPRGWLMPSPRRQTQRAGRLVWTDGGERLGEGADVVAAVVGVQGYPDTAGAGAGADVVLACQRCLHPVGDGRRVPE